MRQLSEWRALVQAGRAEGAYTRSSLAVCERVYLESVHRGSAGRALLGLLLGVLSEAARLLLTAQRCACSASSCSFSPCFEE